MVDLGQVQVGPETKLKAEIVNKQLKLTAAMDTQGLDAELVLKLDLEYVLDAVAAKVPGQLDDTLLALLKGAFLK